MATPSPQRRWQAHCPNCGAPVEFASAASASAVCSYCRSTLLRDGDTLRKIGTSAELFEDYSPLQIGAAGRYAGASFVVVGRLQMAYADGSWNEWHILFDANADQPPRSGWLAEDNGSFVVSFEAPLTERAPDPATLRPAGMQFLAGSAWQVASIVDATIAAAQGELPHPPRMASSYPIVDLRNTQNEVGTLEYGDPSQPTWSVGRAVALADLSLTGLREASGATLQSKAIPCPNCGASLEPKLETTQSIVCAQCQSVVDISQGAGSDLAAYRQTNGTPPQIPLGTTGLLAVSGGTPKEWQVVGYMERCDLPETAEDEQTFWREYLLFNRMEGFCFLVDTEDGWSIVRPMTGAPSVSGSGVVSYQDKPFKKKWTYTAKVTYVLGEFYWRVKREERALVRDFEWRNGNRLELLSSEQTGNEVTWSHGRAVEAAEVRRFFSLPEDQMPALARDVSSGMDQGKIIRNFIIALVVLVVIVALVKACSSDDCQRYKDTYGESSAEYQQCKRSSRGSGVGYVGSSGGSYGGYSSGGGGHK
ncbi:MAG: DUF4178 domain-containing protein [Mitsuaria chitosanitabida]|uniref:DUF4178 domain-containing protein n=1 Tax=Roseateles chitosanitabidus TaxID=65048 RepID=UPI001B25E377|nr:DUF4178 domain-containing protein [Roseateles chitosanitabidus]MBO9685526.1 DUF4178 domain-containing protein [Roseateles chitosanitabidus]